MAQPVFCVSRYFADARRPPSVVTQIKPTHWWPDRWSVLLVAFFCGLLRGTAGIPAPDRLLPENTIFMVTAPNFQKLREIFKASPQNQLWNDDAMRPFRETFLQKWTDEFRKPLERELDLDLEDYFSLLQGQVTFALLPTGSGERESQPIAKLLLIDTRERSDQLKTHLATLRNKWIDGGKTIRIDSVRGFEFSAISLSSNDVPHTFRRLFPPAPPLQELGTDTESKKPVRSELVLGQVDSLLIISSSLGVVEKIVTQLTGGSIPVLGDFSPYDSTHQSMFRDAPLYGWVNVKAYVQNRFSAQSDRKEPEVPDPFGSLNLDRVINASGFLGLKTVAFNFQTSHEGSLFQIYFGAREGSRRGLFQLLGSETKEIRPPPFVPADVTKFVRWRVDARKVWTTIGRIFGELYPQWMGGLDLLLEAANNSTKEKDPGFDLKRYLIGNLGDDIIRYEKAKRAGARPSAPPPVLFLIGSPNPDELATALKAFLVFLNQGATPTERELLGHKIFSLPMPGLFATAIAAGKPVPPRTLNCAPSGGYVALSTDVATLEEYMRSTDSQTKSLGELPGLMEAAQKVTTSGTSLFGYENELETSRAEFELLKKDGTISTNSFTAALTPLLNLPSPQTAIRQWADFSLLPSFERLAKYFHFNVYAVGSSVDGITLKYFSPTPPQME
jgi:hypothetical protein